MNPTYSYYRNWLLWMQRCERSTTVQINNNPNKSASLERPRSKSPPTRPNIVSLKPPPSFQSGRWRFVVRLVRLLIPRRLRCAPLLRMSRIIRRSRPVFPLPVFLKRGISLPAYQFLCLPIQQQILRSPFLQIKSQRDFRVLTPFEERDFPVLRPMDWVDLLAW